MSGDLVCQPNHRDAYALRVVDRRGLDLLDRRRCICRKQQEVCLPASCAQRLETEIELAASDRDGVIADRVHRRHNRLTLKCVRD